MHVTIILHLYSNVVERGSALKWTPRIFVTKYTIDASACANFKKIWININVLDIRHTLILPIHHFGYIWLDIIKYDQIYFYYIFYPVTSISNFFTGTKKTPFSNYVLIVNRHKWFHNKRTSQLSPYICIVYNVLVLFGCRIDWITGVCDAAGLTRCSLVVM